MAALNQAPRLIRTSSDLPPLPADALKGAEVLMLLAPEGHVLQEAAAPFFLLRDMGANVTLAGDPSRALKFDWLCNVMAIAESLWSPLWRQYRTARAQGVFSTMQPVPHPSEISRFDAVILPGGHGRAYASFVMSDRVRAVVQAFFTSDRATGLLCHSVAVAGVSGPSEQPPIAHARQLTAWPRALERILGYLPFGGYFVPFRRYAQDHLDGVAARVHCSALPWRMPHAVIDGNLVTGWGPWSAECFTRALMTVVVERRARRLFMSEQRV